MSATAESERRVSLKAHGVGSIQAVWEHEGMSEKGQRVGTIGATEAGMQMSVKGDRGTRTASCGQRCAQAVLVSRRWGVINRVHNYIQAERSIHKVV